MKALISIDYTYDFVADDGKLTTGKAGQVIEQAVTTHTKKFIEEGDFVVFAIDAHDPSDNFHPENKLFPPHNVIGTNGRRYKLFTKELKNKPMSIGLISGITLLLVEQI